MRQRASSTSTELRHPVNRRYRDEAPLGARVADRVTGFLGSWTFLAIQSVIVLAWIAGNIVLLFDFDPFPFILLNLAFSTQAAYAAPLILLAGNSGESLLQLALTAGGDDFIPRPYTPIMVRTRLKTHVQRLEYSQRLDRIRRTLKQYLSQRTLDAIESAPGELPPPEERPEYPMEGQELGLHLGESRLIHPRKLHRPPSRPPKPGGWPCESTVARTRKPVRNAGTMIHLRRMGRPSRELTGLSAIVPRDRTGRYPASVQVSCRFNAQTIPPSR